MRILKPDAEADVVDAIDQAFRTQTPLVVEGGGSKQGLGHAVESGAVLRLTGLSGITMYEPDEMVFTARAGTPIVEIENALAANGQCLAFEPGDLGPLWGHPPDQATIGGVVAAGVGGPRRFASGAARDHLLGFTAINGKGERFKAGGRVVKNVTGYDLPKLVAGSFGTLCVMTELTLRALPRGAASTVVALEGLKPEEAFRTLRAVASSPFEPAGLAFLPKSAASRVAQSESLTLIRLEGQADGVAARAAELSRTIARGATTLEDETGKTLFRALADVHPFFDRPGPLWRLSLPATRAMNAVERLEPAAWVADWAGGLLWLAPADPAQDVHAIARELGGHATLVRRTDAIRAEVFPPMDAATAALTSRLKAAFDPARILNPGRMYDGV